MNCMYNEDKSTVVWNLRMFSYQAQSKNQIKKTNLFTVYHTERYTLNNDATISLMLKYHNFKSTYFF